MELTVRLFRLLLLVAEEGPLGLRLQMVPAEVPAAVEVVRLARVVAGVRVLLVREMMVVTLQLVTMVVVAGGPAKLVKIRPRWPEVMVETG